MKHNLATYFMLPLLKLNHTNFGGDNFINCYITLTRQVVVVVKDKEEVTWEYWKHQNYVTDFDDQGTTTIIFELPSVFDKDYDNFVEGRYSKFDPITKDVIKKYSGLDYMRPAGTVHGRTPDGELVYDTKGKPVMVPQHTSHRYLLALDKDPGLRAYIEAELETKIKDDAELLDKPSENEYIKL